MPSCKQLFRWIASKVNFIVTSPSQYLNHKSPYWIINKSPQIYYQIIHFTAPHLIAYYHVVFDFPLLYCTVLYCAFLYWTGLYWTFNIPCRIFLHICSDLFTHRYFAAPFRSVLCCTTASWSWRTIMIPSSSDLTSHFLSSFLLFSFLPFSSLFYSCILSSTTSQVRVS